MKNSQTENQVPIFQHAIAKLIAIKPELSSLKNWKMARAFCKIHSCQKGPELTHNIEKHQICDQKQDKALLFVSASIILY